MRAAIVAARWREDMKWASDEAVRRPLWDYPPAARKAVLSERRKRFGIECEYIETLVEDEEDGEW